MSDTPRLTPASTFVIVGVSLAAAAACVCLAPARPDDYDGVLFLRGYQGFDPTRLRPHFPGYPLYLALAHAAGWLFGLEPQRALLAPGVLAALALPGLTALLCRRIAPTSVAVAAALLVAANPLVLRVNSIVGADAIGVAVLLAAFVLRPDRVWRALVAGALLGLAAGAKTDLAGLALLPLLALARRQAPWVLAGCLLGVALWFLPMLQHVDARSWIEAGRAHFLGHVTSYGGGVSSEVASGNFAARVLSGLASAGLMPVGGAWWSWPGHLAAAALGLIALARACRGDRWLALSALPLAIWICLLQNPDNPRHLLPLVLIVCALVPASPLFSARPRRLALACALICATWLAAWPGELARLETPDPAMQAEQWLVSKFRPVDVVLVGHRAPAFLSTFAPSYRTVTVRRDEKALQVIGGLLFPPPIVLVTSELRQLPPARDLLATFERPGRTPGAVERLDIYQVRAAAEGR